MNINLKNEYPEMPESFHSVVFETVHNMEKGDKMKKHNFVKTVLIAAAMTIFLSLSVYAGSQMFDWFNLENSKLTLNIEDESVAPAGYVKLDFSYMPEYIEPTDDYQKYCVKGDTGGLTFILYRNEIGTELEIDYVGDVTEYMFGKNEGVIVELDDNRVFDRQLIIRFDDMGYVLYCFVHQSVTEDDLIKIANGLSLQPTDADSAFIPDSNIPWLED